MYSLLAVSPVWAANQTATTTVTGSNTAATPYISIAVSQDPTASDYETLAVSHENTDAMTVYMAPGGTVSVTSKGTSDYAADTKGVKNEVGGALTIAGDLDLTSTAATADSSVADPSASVAASAYGIDQTITLTDDADTNSGTVTVPGATKLNVSATGGGVTGSGTAVSADAYAYGINNATDNIDLNGSRIPGRATMSLGAVSGSVTAAGGTANVASSSSNDAYAEAYGVENMGVLTLDSVDLTVEAKGGTIAAGTGTANAEAYGIETNVGSTNGSKSKLTVAGTTNLQVTAVAGNPSGEGKVATSYATAYGINDYPMNWSGSYDSMDTGAITATVTAQAGTVNTNDSYIDTQAYGLCANGVVTTGALDLTVTATGGTVSGTTNNTANTAYAYTRAEGLFNNNVSTIQINGDTTLNITATGSTAAEGGAFSDNDVYAAGTDIYNGATLTLQDLTATVSASGGSYTEVNGIYMGYGSTTVENLDLTTSVTPGGGANEYFAADSLYADDGGTINVGTDGATATGATVQLEGDVQAINNGTVNLTLATADSYLQGNVQTMTHKTIDGSPDGDAGTVNLTVTNGATWRPVYDNRYGSRNTADETYNYDEDGNYLNTTYNYNIPAQSATTTDNSIGTLALSNGGIVDLTWDNATRDAATAGRTLTITELNGEGGVFKINSNLAQNKADEITLGENSTSTSVGIDVAYDPALTASTLTKGSSVTGKALVLTDKSGNLTSVKGVADFYNIYNYTPTITMGTDGQWYLTGLTIDKVTPQGPASGAVRSAGQDRLALNDLFLVESNSLAKRMGELRDYAADVLTDAKTAGADVSADRAAGVWARYQNGKLEQGDASMKVQFVPGRLRCG
jgi:hypothetical protein